MRPILDSLAILNRRANMMRKLGCAAWEELPGGVLRVKYRSPQFALRAFCEDLCALAEREGYSISEDGPLVWAWRVYEYVKVREFLVFTPREESLEIGVTKDPEPASI